VEFAANRSELILAFFTEIFTTPYISRLPRIAKEVLLDVALPLPPVLPPTLQGYYLPLVFRAKRPFDRFSTT
jgi:ABC-type molybdate transport system permease subunit